MILRNVHKIYSCICNYCNNYLSRLFVCLFAERPCPLPCANGGQCTSGICRCKGDFTGEYCETSGKMIILKDSNIFVNISLTTVDSQTQIIQM